LAALRHTLEIFVFILLFSFIIGLVFEAFGEEPIAAALSGMGIFQPMLTALVGLVPNCAVSVLLAQLYVQGAISFGSLFAGLLALAVGLPAQAETWRFALIGDTPYSDYERAELPKMLSAIAERHVEFIAHIGDFKSGSSRCDDALFEDRYKLFQNSRVPFIFVPGDNEWTDCERLSNGAYDPLERLGKLRRLFWEDEFSLGKTQLPLARQAGGYPEHSRFRLGPVLFVTLNLPGGNNNWGLTSEARPEFLARNPVVLAWLRDSFNLANREQLAGIVLLFQANPGSQSTHNPRVSCCKEQPR
jgi:hypothetical protein